MSYTETHVGKLRKVDLEGLTLEQWSEKKCREKGDIELSSYYDDWREQFIDTGNNYRKYFIVNDEIYEAFDHIEGNDGNDIDILIPNNDGTYNFVMQFYNGGTCLSEMIEDAIKRVNKSK